jgi:hypothetical protein
MNVPKLAPGAPNEITLELLPRASSFRNKDLLVSRQILFGADRRVIEEYSKRACAHPLVFIGMGVVCDSIDPLSMRDN